jgi:hypothetical protein
MKKIVRFVVIDAFVLLFYGGEKLIGPNHTMFIGLSLILSELIIQKHFK